MSEQKDKDLFTDYNDNYICQYLFKNIFYQYTFLVTQMIKNLPAMCETQVRSLGQEDSLEK